MAKRRTLMEAMGSTINEINNGGSFTGAKQLSQMIPLKEIKLDPEFQALFPLDEDMVADVVRSIEASGFDPTQPLVVWKEEGVLIDGHTRYAAAQRASLFDVPVFYKSFPDRDAAMFHALGLQLFRRNLTQQQMVSAAGKLIDLGEKTGNVRIKDIRISLEKRLDVGKSTAKRILAVARNEEAREAVESGEKTVNQAFNDIKKREYTREAKEEEPSEEQIPEESQVSEDGAEDAIGESSAVDAGGDNIPDNSESSDSGLSGDFSMMEDDSVPEDEAEDEVSEEDAGDEASYEEPADDDGGYDDAGESASDELPVRQAPAAKEVPVRAEPKAQRMPERKPEKLPEADADDGEYFEDNDADQNFVDGFKMAFWYVLAEIERKTTVNELLSWFAGRKSFSADSLRAFEIPDYDQEIQESLKRRLKEMTKK